MCSHQVNDQVTMVQLHNSDLGIIPKEVLLACKQTLSRKKKIEQETLMLIQDIFFGDVSRLETKIAQIQLRNQGEIEVMARVIVTKALDEPQNCSACVSLSGALHTLFPALPSAHHLKTEGFMHALLDAFQTEFETLFLDSSDSKWGGPQMKENRTRAIVQFAGHLYTQGLLGNGVVSEMVHDLVDQGSGEAANQLLWFIGVVPNSLDCGSLCTVQEDSSDSDGAST